MTSATPNNAVTGLRILIIEDESVVGILLEELLEEAGAAVSLAETIAEAQDAIRQGNFDGVLLDINLHGQTTSGIADELNNRSIPFIVMTGYDNRAGDPPALKAAPRLLKPFKRIELLSRVAEVFRGGEKA